MTTTPRPIEPQDIRVGMRVRRTWRSEDDSRGDWAEFVVTEIDSGIIMRSGGVGWPADRPNVTWTLLADAPTPQRETGSRWRDPKNNVSYIVADDGVYLPYTYREQSLAGLDECVSSDAAAIARLTPLPAFDPAVLWPKAASAERECGKNFREGDRLWHCCRVDGHDGIHAAYSDRKTPAYLWGDPR